MTTNNCYRNILDSFLDLFITFYYQKRIVVKSQIEIGSNEITYLPQQQAEGYICIVKEKELKKDTITAFGVPEYKLFLKDDINLKEDDKVIFNNKTFFVISEKDVSHLSNMYIYLLKRDYETGA